MLNDYVAKHDTVIDAQARKFHGEHVDIA